MGGALVQEIAEYIVREPGSVYARDHAVSKSDFYHVAAKVLPCDNKFAEDEVSLAL